MFCNFIPILEQSPDIFSPICHSITTNILKPYKNLTRILQQSYDYSPGPLSYFAQRAYAVLDASAAAREIVRSLEQQIDAGQGEALPIRCLSYGHSEEVL